MSASKIEHRGVFDGSSDSLSVDNIDREDGVSLPMNRISSQSEILMNV